MRKALRLSSSKSQKSETWARKEWGGCGQPGPRGAIGWKDFNPANDVSVCLLDVCWFASLCFEIHFLTSLEVEQPSQNRTEL